MTLAENPRRLGAKIGLLAVLHTWGQTLTHHPHVHCVVPGGGVSLDGRRWIACKPSFFLPVKVTVVVKDSKWRRTQGRRFRDLDKGPEG
ncbi:transposase [Methylocystis sp. H62]|nr:transposase [Methylocystis sp. H62]